MPSPSSWLDASQDSSFSLADIPFGILVLPAVHRCGLLLLLTILHIGVLQVTGKLMNFPLHSLRFPTTTTIT